MKIRTLLLGAGMAWTSLAMAGVIKVDYHAEFGGFGGFPSGTQINGSYYFDEDAEPTKVWPDTTYYPVIQHRASFGALEVSDSESEIGVADDIEHPAPSNLLRDRYTIFGHTSSALNSDILLMAFGIHAEVDAEFSNPALVNRNLPLSEEDLAGFPITYAVVTFENLIDGRYYAVHALTGLQFTPINTAPGIDVMVTPETLDECGNPAPFAPVVSLVFAEVIDGGNTSNTVTRHGPPPPAGFHRGCPAVYFALESDAVYTGPVSVCIDFSTLGFRGRSRDLRLAHYVDDGWIDITDDVSGELSAICGTASGLGLFTIVEPELGPSQRHRRRPRTHPNNRSDPRRSRGGKH